MIKFGRVETAEDGEHTLPEPSATSIALWTPLRGRGSGKLGPGAPRGKEDCARVLQAPDHGTRRRLGRVGERRRLHTGAPTTGAEDAGEDEAVGSSAEAAGDAAGEEEDKSQAASTKSSYVTPSSDEEHRKQLDDAVTLLTDNLQPVPGTTGAVSEGASKFASLGGNVVLRVAVGSVDTPLGEKDDTMANSDIAPVLTKEGSMTEMRMLSISETSSTHSLTKRMSMEVMQSAAISAGV